MLLGLLHEGPLRFSELEERCCEPAPRPRGPAPPVEFRITSFEPGVQVQHTLAVTVTEFACHQGPPGTIRTLMADSRRWE
jgi:hypothetical protein